MTTCYDLLLVGATALAGGIAAAHPELRIAVAEAGGTCAPEFVAALKTDGNEAAFYPRTTEAAELCREARQRGAFDARGAWLPAFSPIVAERFAECDCFFMANLTAMTAIEGRYEATVCVNGIQTTLTAACVVDTTARRLTRAFTGANAPELTMSLCYLNGNGELRSRPCTDFADARATLAENLPADEQILFTAWEPALTLPLTQDEQGGILWVPSAAYPNLPAAFDAGAALMFHKGHIPALTEPTPVDDGVYDVIVVGLGTAGAMAAITAAGQGLRALGIEALHTPGGAGTAGGVQSYYYGFKGGFYTQVDNSAREQDDRYIPTVGLGAQQKAAALDRYLRQTGVDCRFGAMFHSVLQQDNAVFGVRFTEYGVPHIARAAYVIDCTAEAAVCVSAGCEMLGGRSFDGEFQPYSSVNFFLDTAQDGTTRLRCGYMDNGTVDQYDPLAFGRAVREAAVSSVHLREDYSDHTYLGIVPLFGLREGRRIVGEEIVRLTDLLNGTGSKQPVYYGWSNLDNHGKDSVFENQDYQDFITVCGLWGWGISIPVPVGALIPRGKRGLLTAGRSVSTEHNVAMGLRMKDDVQKSGEVAARLVSLSLRNGTDVRQVDVTELRIELFSSGCLKESDRPLLEKQQGNVKYEWPFWCDDDESIAAGLASNAPGYYIWSAAALEKRTLLRRLLEQEDRNLRWHAALALALLDEADDETVSALIEAALSRDGFVPHNGREYNPPRAVSAICALGRLRAAAAVPALLSLLDDTFIDSIPFNFFPNLLICDREDLRFQYTAHTVAALCAIAAAHPAKHAELASRLRDFVKDRRFLVSMMGNHSYKNDRTAALRRMVEKLG